MKHEKPSTNSNVDPSNARNPEYKKAMDEIVTTTECPLCTLKWHPNPIIRDDGYWLLTKNGFPYEDTKQHLLMIAKRHIVDIGELTDQEAISMFKTVKWANTEFNIEGGGLAMRYGNPKYTGATITHLHAHLIQSELAEPDSEGKIKAKVVKFPFG
jgi:diadenosine tetraphosphate (Ap4A) HIT family hydrolase